MLKQKKKNSVLNIERPNNLLKIEEKTSEKKAGRKPIPVENKGTESISIKVTKSQKEYLEKQAGLVPLATYLKAKLKESGVL